jgi:hypothetical protein
MDAKLLLELPHINHLPEVDQPRLRTLSTFSIYDGYKPFFDTLQSSITYLKVIRLIHISVAEHIYAVIYDGYKAFFGNPRAQITSLKLIRLTHTV